MGDQVTYDDWKLRSDRDEAFMMGNYDRSDPDWTFDDSWMQEDEERARAPLAFVSCPCCGGLGHYGPAAWGQGGYYCTGRVDRIRRDLAEYVRTGRILAEVLEEHASCERCGDEGVIPLEDA